MKVTTVRKLVIVIILSVISIIMFTQVSMADMAPPVTRLFDSYRTVKTASLELKQSQTVYFSYNMPYNGYFQIKKADNTVVLQVSRLLNPSLKSFYLQAGTYTVVTYGGDGMANGQNVNDNGILLYITYIAEATGKLVRIIEGTGTFTTRITTNIYYDWSGGVGTSSLPGYTCNRISPACLQITGPTPLTKGPYAEYDKFAGKPGSYSVSLSGGNFTPDRSSTIYITGSVDIWYDDTKPGIIMESSKADGWVKGSDDGSVKLDYTISFSNIQNSATPLRLKVFVGPEGQAAVKFKEYPFNPANNTNPFITDSWPIPANVNGRYQAYAELIEDNGTNCNLGASNKIYFNIDNTPPTHNVTKSPDQAYYSSVATPKINFNYTANDTGSGLNHVIVKIDGIAQPPYTGEQAASGNYQWTIPSSGQHTISFTANDSAGNTSIQSFTIDIDNTSPEFPGNLQVNPAPVYQSYVSSNIVTYAWTAVNEAHFKEYQIKIDSAFLNNPTGWTTVVDWTSTGGSTSYSYNIPTEYNGQMLKATVKAVDLAGNEANITNIIISDQSVPIISLPGYATRFQTGTTPGTGKVVCKWNIANDNIDGVTGSGSGIDHYDLALTATSILPDQSPPLQSAMASWNQYEFANVSSSGSYYFWVRGVDRAGNPGAWTMSGPFPDFQANGPGHNTSVMSAVFQATARTLPLPDQKELRFQLKYKRTDANTYSTLPGGYQTAAINPSLNFGNWNWYLEIKEYDSSGNPIPESFQTTEIFTFHMENDSIKPVTLEPVTTTPGTALQLSAQVVEPERVVSYLWETGDGVILNGQSPQHGYRLDYDSSSQSAVKVYPLKVIVTFTDGTSFIAETTVTVQNTSNGTLHTHETWWGIHHIYGDVIVPEGITLTIKPGTQVIIQQSPGQTGYGNGLTVNGIMNAGTGVVFQLANGTTLDGWKGITITGRASLDHVSIYHAQRAVTTVNTDNVTISYSKIANNYTGVHVCGGHPTISYTTFSGNTLYAIKEENGWPKVTHCTFTGNGIDYYHDTLTKITLEQLNTLPGRGNEGNGN
jgi:hypothetical protein